MPEAGTWVRLEVPAEVVNFPEGSVLTGISFIQLGGTVHWDKVGIVTRLPLNQKYFDGLGDWVKAQQRLNGANLPEPLQQILRRDPSQWQPGEQASIRAHFITHAFQQARADFAPLLKELTRAEAEMDAVYETIPRTLVFAERKAPRPTHVLQRGQYDRPGKQVEPGTPAFLPPFPADLPRNRLGLARWLTSDSHPLTARVAVNRFWQQIFGTGLVRTVDDFGTKGEAPSHPELLDWLAVDFQANGWDVKRLLKQYRPVAHLSSGVARRPGTRIGRSRQPLAFAGPALSTGRRGAA